MPRILVALFALAALLTAAAGESRAAACADVARIDPDSGIGGTGHADPDSGVGGTGIFGTITGFASVCVNGLEIHYDPDVSVTSNGEPASTADLAVGRVVWILAAKRGERLVADSIAMLSALVGPLDHVDPERGLLVVAGETVEVPPSAIVLGRPGGTIESGIRVDVSGLRRPDGRVVASRVDVAGPGALRSSMLHLDVLLRGSPQLDRLSVEGFADVRAGVEGLRLGGVEVDTSGVPRRGDEAGLRVRLEGPLREGVLRAERMTFERAVLDRPERPPPAPEPPPTPDPPQLDRPELIDRPETPLRPDLPTRPIRPESFERSVTR